MDRRRISLKSVPKCRIKRLLMYDMVFKIMCRRWMQNWRSSQITTIYQGLLLPDWGECICNCLCIHIRCHKCWLRNVLYIYVSGFCIHFQWFSKLLLRCEHLFTTVFPYGIMYLVLWFTVPWIYFFQELTLFVVSFTRDATLLLIEDGTLNLGTIMIDSRIGWFLHMFIIRIVSKFDILVC